MLPKVKLVVKKKVHGIFREMSHGLFPSILPIYLHTGKAVFLLPQFCNPAIFPSSAD